MLSKFMVECMVSGLRSHCLNLLKNRTCGQEIPQQYTDRLEERLQHLEQIGHNYAVQISSLASEVEWRSAKGWED